MAGQRTGQDDAHPGYARRGLPFRCAGLMRDVIRERRYIQGVTDQEPRRVSMPLMIGMLTVAPLVCWFLLRRGYARSTRTAGFALAFLPTFFTG